MNKSRAQLIIFIMCISMIVSGIISETSSLSTYFIGENVLPMQGMTSSAQVNLKDDLFASELKITAGTETEVRLPHRRANSRITEIIRLVVIGLLSCATVCAVSLSVLYLDGFIADKGQRLFVIRYIHDKDGRKARPLQGIALI